MNNSQSTLQRDARGHSANAALVAGNTLTMTRVLSMPPINRRKRLVSGFQASHVLATGKFGLSRRASLPPGVIVTVGNEVDRAFFRCLAGGEEVAHPQDQRIPEE